MNDSTRIEATEDESGEVEGQRFIAPVPGAPAEAAVRDDVADDGGEVEGHRFIAPEPAGPSGRA